MNGVATKDRLVSIWVNSHYLCSALLIELFDLGNKQQPSDNKHKKKNSGRIHSDVDDRRTIRTTLGKCIHPQELDSRFLNALLNICTSEESNQSVNLNKANELGTK